MLLLPFSGLGLLKETKTVIPGVAEVITRTRINFIGLSFLLLSFFFFFFLVNNTEANQPTRERETETDRQTKRETDRQTEREAGKHAGKERERLSK